ncbi:IS66 family insertion sequence element accessory protein TnpA [Pseudomonas veronii]|uniref:IS66 family insertion sequence element accessory protein TnpB n=2 Tax=Pseudomonas TaxID=286 RepID=A0A7X1X2T5_9PSED|nr:IS66 family insertion sequence element accessory protein TnpB [Pseudomonas fragi]MBM1204916.1 IS66 family insertion sequence element accessory protein TnpB [Pseudomonas fragi]MQT78215.1 IS66 family insertion sequence element accessory protein TnpB [Pseudomonas helleri]NMY58160.1 IS66 family insertion sequence element accessory protein TnpB [Pseudomonas sp. WS 5051]
MSVRRELWIAHVQAWRSSGLTQVAYCQQHELSSKRLAYWIKRGNPNPAELPLTLVPVTLRHSPATVQLLLRHASGWSLALPSSVEPAWLAELLRGMV